MTYRRQIFAAFFVLFLNHIAVAEDGVATGTVVSPSGEPVSGAEVIISTPNVAAWPNLTPEKRRDYQQGAVTATTDASGTFSVKLPADAGLLCVHHPKLGYAEISPANLANSPQVKLEPWCRVEGVFKIGAKTAPAGTPVSLGTFGWGANAARVHYGYETKTDADGCYVLDRVPAGVVKIETRATKASAPLQQYTSAAPEQPTVFNVGGLGRPVVGKLILPASVDLTRLHKWPGVNSQCHLRRDVPWPSDVREAGNLPDQEREDAVRAWRKTPEAVAAYKDEYRCDFSPKFDGTFRFEDVPPGKYVLTISFYSMVQGESSQELVSKKVDVIVPESPAPTDETLDLGDIELSVEGL